jgi:hypothetical protein
MSLLSSIRFQEVHSLLTHLFSQDGPQRPVIVTRKSTRQFVILSVPHLRELQHLLLPYEKHDNVHNIWLIDIAKFRKGILSFERTCDMFKQSGEYWADVLLVLKQRNPIGALFRYERYEAILAFLRSKGVVLSDVFTCDVQRPPQTDRMLPMAAAIQHFSALPAQFDTEQNAYETNLPVLVSHNRTPVMAVFPWALYQSLMQELASRELSGELQTLVIWWLSAQSDTVTTQVRQQIPVVYVLIHPDGSEVIIHSLDEFDRVALDVLIYRLVYEHTGNIEHVDSDSKFTLETIDLLVPEPEAWKQLLTFVSWNPSFFTNALFDSALGNCLDAAHLVCEQVYLHVRALFENRWLEVVEGAQSVRDASGNSTSPTEE